MDIHIFISDNFRNYILSLIMELQKKKNQDRKAKLITYPLSELRV